MTSILARAERSQQLSVSFDPVGYDPSEWEELFADIDTALERGGLPSLHGERWEPLEFGFEFSGAPDEVFRVKSVLEQFAMRVYLEGNAPRPQPVLSNRECPENLDDRGNTVKGGVLGEKGGSG